MVLRRSESPNNSRLRLRTSISACQIWMGIRLVEPQTFGALIEQMKPR
jgi:hypothetical protein